MNNVAVIIEVVVNPTEDEEKVKKAVQNIFQYSVLESVPRNCGKLLIMKAEGKEGLTNLRALVKQERILSATQKIMFKGLGENNIIFYLNRQAAYVKHISFCNPEGESPLGPIKVEIRCDNPKEIIRWITSETT